MTPKQEQPPGCGLFAPCELDASHDGPHSAGMYPEWRVPTMEPMAFIAPAATPSPSSGLDVADFIRMTLQRYKGTVIQAAVIQMCEELAPEATKAAIAAEYARLQEQER